MGGPRLLPAAGAVVALLAVLAMTTPASADIYWANEGSDSIGRAELDGSSPDGGHIAGATDPTGVAIDGEFAYWSHAGDGNPAGAIGRVDLGLGGPMDQDFVIVTAGTPGGVAVDSAWIYWTQSTIGRAGSDGAPVSQMFVNADNTGTGACGIASDGDEALWAVGPAGSGGLRATHGPFGPNPGFLGGLDDPCGVARAGDHVYWTDRGTDTIGRAAFNAALPDEDFIDTGSGSDPCGVAVDENFVYLTNRGSDSVSRAPLAGPGAPAEIVTAASGEVDDPCGIAVSPTAAADPVAHEFAPTPAGEASDIHAFLIRNTASSVLDVSQLSLTGADAGDFEITGDACTTGAASPGTGCVVNVRFAPTGTGERTATLTATSNASDSPTTVSLSGTGTPAVPGEGGDDGGGGGDVPPSDRTAPEILSADVKPAKFEVNPNGPAETPLARAKRGTRFTYALSEAALLGIAIERKSEGRLVNGTCVPEKDSNRDNPECTRIKRLGTFAQQSAAGANEKPFAGWIGQRRLRPGSYQAVLVAVDAALNFSEPRTLGFRVLRPRR